MLKLSPYLSIKVKRVLRRMAETLVYCFGWWVHDVGCIVLFSLQTVFFSAGLISLLQRAIVLYPFIDQSILRIILNEIHSCLPHINDILSYIFLNIFTFQHCNKSTSYLHSYLTFDKYRYLKYTCSYIDVSLVLFFLPKSINVNFHVWNVLHFVFRVFYHILCLSCYFNCILMYLSHISHVHFIFSISSIFDMHSCICP